ncbi:MAG: citramalate synthase, partial [Planctomycetes bacterium]|nr:citramalate synthase [Planctomycetota bacterium]
EDYKVRVIDAGGGAEAKVCVTIEAADREDETSWSTGGASENLIEASWAALKDSIVYGLLRKNKRG